MAALPAPVVTVSGLVRATSTVEVPAYEGREAGRDEDGTYRGALPARAAYQLGVVVVDTGLGGVVDDAGVAEVTVRQDQHESVAFGRGEAVNLFCRPYAAWAGRPGHRFPVTRFAYVAKADAGTSRLASAV